MKPRTQKHLEDITSTALHQLLNEKLDPDSRDDLIWRIMKKSMELLGNDKLSSRQLVYLRRLSEEKAALWEQKRLI